MANEKLENSNTGSGAVPNMAGSHSFWRWLPLQCHAKQTILWSSEFISK